MPKFFGKAHLAPDEMTEYRRVFRPNANRDSSQIKMSTQRMHKSKTPDYLLEPNTLSNMSLLDMD